MVAVIICGPRDYKEYSVVKKAIEESKYDITEVVSGGATGVDTLGEQWATENQIPIKPFPADWNDIKAPGAIVKVNSWGKKYNANAGFARNKQMAEYAAAQGGACIAIDNHTPGTADMIKQAKAAGLDVFIYDVDSAKNDGDYIHVFGN